MITRANRLEATPQAPQKLPQLIASISKRARFRLFMIFPIRLSKHFQIARMKIPIHGEESPFTFIPGLLGLVDYENAPVPLLMTTQFRDVQVVDSGSLPCGDLGRDVSLALSDSLLLRYVGSEWYVPDVDTIGLFAATCFMLFASLLVECLSQRLEMLRIGGLGRCILDLDRPLGAFICDVEV